MKEKTCRTCGEQYNAYIDFCFRDGEKLEFIATSDSLLDDTLSDNSMVEAELSEEDDSTETFNNENTGGIRLDSLDESTNSFTDEEPTEIDIFNDDQPTVLDVPKSFSFPSADDSDESLEGPTLLDNTLLFSRADMSDFDDEEEEEDTFISAEPISNVTRLNSGNGAAEKLFSGNSDILEASTPVNSPKAIQNPKSNGVGLIIIGVSSALTAIAVVSLLFLWTADDDQTNEPTSTDNANQIASNASKSDGVEQATDSSSTQQTPSSNIATDVKKTEVVNTSSDDASDPAVDVSESSEGLNAQWKLQKIVITKPDGDEVFKPNKLSDSDKVVGGKLDTSQAQVFKTFQTSFGNGSYQLNATFADGTKRSVNFEFSDNKIKPYVLDFSAATQAP